MQGNILIISIVYLFFENIIAYIILCPMIFLYIKYAKKKLIERRKEDLKMQFCESLEAIEVLLKSGNSIEQAFINVLDELEHLQGSESYMVNEIKNINKCIELDISVEDAINDLAIRADIVEIYNFADVFAISKRSEGNIIRVINTVCSNIRDNIDMNRHIRMSISGVLQEITIMKFMPLGILLYLKVFSNGYFDCVHKNIAGQFIMSVILGIYFVACTTIDYMQRKVLK